MILSCTREGSDWIVGSVSYRRVALTAQGAVGSLCLEALQNSPTVEMWSGATVGVGIGFGGLGSLFQP